MMEITLETIYQQQLADKVELKAVEQRLHRLEIEVAREIGGAFDAGIEREFAGVKQALADSPARIIQWVVSLFIGSMVTLATLGGIYISVLLAR